jgi:hypothetical protein
LTASGLATHFYMPCTPVLRLPHTYAPTGGGTPPPMHGALPPRNAHARRARRPSRARPPGGRARGAGAAPQATGFFSFVPRPSGRGTCSKRPLSLAQPRLAQLTPAGPALSPVHPRVTRSLAARPHAPPPSQHLRFRSPPPRRRDRHPCAPGDFSVSAATRPPPHIGAPAPQNWSTRRRRCPFWRRRQRAPPVQPPACACAPPRSRGPAKSGAPAPAAATPWARAAGARHPLCPAPAAPPRPRPQRRGPAGGGWPPCRAPPRAPAPAVGGPSRARARRAPRPALPAGAGAPPRAARFWPWSGITATAVLRI